MCAKEVHVRTPLTRLDEFAPVYQFSEFHSRRIAAPPEQIYRAVKSVTAQEITLFRTLVWLRRFGRSGPESILNPPPHVPVLDVATKTSFIILAEEADCEIVLGTMVISPRGWRASGRLTGDGFKAVCVTARTPGFAAGTINFRIEESGPTECTLTTETRVYATDAVTRRRFARYWRVIYPGSAFIRLMWLRAIARRAESR